MDLSFLGFENTQKLVKGEEAKTRLPDTLQCSKSKMCTPRKLKPYHHVVLIIKLDGVGPIDNRPFND